MPEIHHSGKMPESSKRRNSLFWLFAHEKDLARIFLPE
jgi:hypothetical protein